MKGKECRADGGKVYEGADSNVVKEARGAPDKNDPKDEGKKHGGRVKKKRGGSVEGMGKKPHMGRPGRKMGGGVGSDKNPLSSANSPSAPKGRHLDKGGMEP